MVNITKQDLYEAIQMLVEIPSIRDESTIDKGAPFGREIRKAMDLFMQIAKKWGFRTKDLNGYACYAEIGPINDDYIGVLGHLDVVHANQEGWHTEPFRLTKVEDVMFGRGINDDKGPLLGALYAAYKVAHSGISMQYPIRIIAGGAEETTWECMDYYFKQERQPIYAFSPDGNFPIVNGEKGILQLELIFEVDSDLRFESEVQRMYNCFQLKVNQKDYKSGMTLSRNPHRSDHAVFNWLSTYQGKSDQIVQFLLSLRDYNLYINVIDDEMGDVSLCVMYMNTYGSKHILGLDIRYHKSMPYDEIIKKFENYPYHILRSLDTLYVDPNSKLISALKQAYLKVVGVEAEVITKGGASYARVLDNGVAFGATFPDEHPNPHMANEHMKWSSLLKAIEIYIESLKILSQNM